MKKWAGSKNVSTNTCLKSKKQLYFMRNWEKEGKKVYERKEERNKEEN